MIQNIPGQILSTRIVTLDDALHATGTEVVEPISNVRRPHPAFVLDLSGENLRHHLFYEHPIELGGVLKSEWADAALFGWDAFHAFLNARGDFTCQDVVGTASRIDRHLLHRPDPAYLVPDLNRTDNALTLDFSKFPDNAVGNCPTEMYFGSPIEPLNWGTWLLHCVPSAMDYITSQHSGSFGCWFKLGWQRTLLNFVGIPDERLFQVDEWKTYAVERLTFRSYPNIDPYVGQHDRQTFVAIARRCLQRSEGFRPPKIFVSRRTRSTLGAARRLANEAELAEALEHIGFVVVEPEALPFEDQVAVFASASAIVGLGGAGLFNVVFSKPGTKVVSIEASNVFIHSHANLFSSLELDYAVIFGKRDEGDERWPHHGWTIDVPRAVACINEFI